MRRPIGWLPFGLIFCLACGGKPPAPPETKAEGAARVFAVAQNLESEGKNKQALDAYRQVVQHFPDTPEASKAAERLAKAQTDATRNAATRKRP